MRHAPTRAHWRRCALAAILAVVASAALAETPTNGSWSPGGITNKGGDRTFKPYNQGSVWSSSRDSTIIVLPDSPLPNVYSSTDGNFTAALPMGCSTVNKKVAALEATSAGPGARMVLVAATRRGFAGEGCSVEARLGAAGGLTGQVAGQAVVRELQQRLEQHDVRPVRRKVVHLDFGDHGKADGLEYMAREGGNGKCLWVRGLLVGDDMYFLQAWTPTEAMFEDRAYADFFDSFRPWPNASPRAGG